MNRISLSECLDYVIDNRGVTPGKKNTKWSNSGVPVLSAKNVKSNELVRIDEIRYAPNEVYDSWMKKPLVKGDLLLTSEAPAGEIYYWDSDEKVIVGQRLFGLKVKNEISSKYLKYYLESPTGQKLIKGQLSGSTVFGISSKTFDNIMIELPDYKDQVKIGEILYSIDKQIYRNKLMVQKLQVLGNAIFTRFFKEEKMLTGLLKFPYISIIKPGIDRFDNKKRYLATAEVDESSINYDAPFINYGSRESRANMQPINNSIWFAKMKNSIKHIFISSKSKLLVTNYVLSTGFLGIKCEEIAYEYMVNYLRLPYFEAIKDKLSHGATQEAINNEDLRSIKIQLPSKNKLKEFHNMTKTIYENISEIEEITYKLSSLRNMLLPLLINGQLG